MQRRPYKITLEKIETPSTLQHFDNIGSFTTEEVTDKIEYEIIRMQNLVIIEVLGKVFRAGDRISEEAARTLCDGSYYDVTVTKKTS